MEIALSLMLLFGGLIGPDNVPTWPLQNAINIVKVKIEIKRRAFEKMGKREREEEKREK